MGLNEQLAEIGRLIAVPCREHDLADVTRRRHDSYSRGATCAPETLRCQSGRVLRSPKPNVFEGVCGTACLFEPPRIADRAHASAYAPSDPASMWPTVTRGAAWRRLMRVLGEGRTEVPCGGCSWAGDPVTISTYFGDSGWHLPPAEGRSTAKAQVPCLEPSWSRGSWHRTAGHSGDGTRHAGTRGRVHGSPPVGECVTPPWRCRRPG